MGAAWNLVALMPLLSILGCTGDPLEEFDARIARGVTRLAEHPSIQDSIRAWQSAIKVAVLPFRLNSSPTEMGTWLCERVEEALSHHAGVLAVIDKAHLDRILWNARIEQSDLYDPATVQGLGRFAGVDAICIGDYSVFTVRGESYIETKVKVLGTGTATVLGETFTVRALESALPTFSHTPIKVSTTLDVALLKPQESNTARIDSRERQPLPSPQGQPDKPLKRSRSGASDATTSALATDVDIDLASPDVQIVVAADESVLPAGIPPYHILVDWSKPELRVLEFCTASPGEAPSSEDLRKLAVDRARLRAYFKLHEVFRYTFPEPWETDLDMRTRFAPENYRDRPALRDFDGSVWGRGWFTTFNDGSVIAFQEVILPRRFWREPLPNLLSPSSTQR